MFLAYGNERKSVRFGKFACTRNENKRPKKKQQQQDMEHGVQYTAIQTRKKSGSNTKTHRMPNNLYYLLYWDVTVTLSLTIYFHGNVRQNKLDVINEIETKCYPSIYWQQIVVSLVFLYYVFFWFIHQSIYIITFLFLILTTFLLILLAPAALF